MSKVKKGVEGSGDVQRQAVAWGVGLNFVYGFLGFGAIGWAVQTWLWKDAAPWPMLVGLGVGLVGGMYRFVKDALKMNA
jgi:F0F1-type ATP synthase assembly protein I